MASSFEMFFDELGDRFDPRYYDPKVLAMLREFKRKEKRDGFRVLTLGSCAKKVKKGIFDILASSYRSSGVPFVRVSDVKSMTIDRADLTHISEELNKEEIQTCMVPGDVLITKGGTVGMVALVPRWMKYCNISQDLIGISLDKERINSGYVAAFLDSYLGRIQLNRARTQQIQSHLTLDSVKEIRLLIPPDEVYDTIVQKVDVIEKKREAAERIWVDAIQRTYDSIDVPLEDIPDRMSYMVRAKSVEDSFIPRFYYPKYLEMLKRTRERLGTSRLGTLVDIDRGREVGSNNYVSYINKGSDFVGFIRTSDFVNGMISDSPDWFIRPEIHKSLQEQQDLRPGDVLFSNDGTTIGYTAQVSRHDHCVIQSHLRRLRLKKGRESELDPGFLFAYLNTEYVKMQIKQRTIVQSTIGTIRDGLRDFEIPNVSIAEQRRIGKKVFEAFELKTEGKKLHLEVRFAIESLCPPI